jgi:P4 family phage/plasmid primase-like protien
MTNQSLNHNGAQGQAPTHNNSDDVFLRAQANGYPDNGAPPGVHQTPTEPHPDEQELIALMFAAPKIAGMVCRLTPPLTGEHLTDRRTSFSFRAANALIPRRTPVTRKTVCAELEEWANDPNGKDPTAPEAAREWLESLTIPAAPDVEAAKARALQLAAAIRKRYDDSLPPWQEEEVPTAPSTPAAPKIPAPSLIDEKGNPEYDPAQLVALLHPNWGTQNLATHAAAAQRIRDLLGEVLCYSANLGWLGYNGRHWQRDDKHATQSAARVATLTQAVRDESAALYNFAATLAQAGRAKDADAMSKAAKAHGRHTKQIESKAFIEGALHLAAGLLAVETELFDQKPWLIGFQNGTWDKGQFREHRREDYLLHLSPVHLDYEADRAEWMAVLNRITAADLDFAQMAQDVCGYIFSAASHLRLLPFFYGPKGTGKSTFTELLQTVLGDMAATIDPKKLQDSAARERLGADLWNRRLAACSEAGSQKLEAELLKTLSGGDRLAVRFLFREAFTAPPRHVLLMVTNDPPRIDAYDAALKDRVIALPFVHALDTGGPLELTGGRRIEAVRQNHDSPLVRGFAAWAMEGLARVWHSQEIHRAKCAATATAKFWADTDQVTPFWETIEEAELLAGIGKSELRKGYETWCEAEGARAFNRSQWARACKAHGLEEEQRTGGKRFWCLARVAQVA